ncbi:PAS domain-containing protein [Luteimicrobium sp. NPDC057192]|uniref:PAS domain-containing protein n=1 Tax=Luteimicrobium sp. NPDC057192 TaxID=3346042 RepID=UPI00362988FC
MRPRVRTLAWDGGWFIVGDDGPDGPPVDEPCLGTHRHLGARGLAVTAGEAGAPGLWSRAPDAVVEPAFSRVRPGVLVLDARLRVLAWNERSTDLWGVREDDVIGRALTDLDIGLPVEQLVPLVREQLVGSTQDSSAHLGAVNRRGRSIELEVTASALRRGEQEIVGAILVMRVATPAVGAAS